MTSIRLLIFIVGCLPASTLASVIDQSNLYTTPLVNPAYLVVAPINAQPYVVGQSFTVGMSGTLDSISLQILSDTMVTPPENVVVSIYSLSDGLPNPEPIASAEADAEAIIADDWSNPATVSFDFIDNAIAVSAGDQFAIVLTAFSPVYLLIESEENQWVSNQYAG